MVEQMGFSEKTVDRVENRRRGSFPGTTPAARRTTRRPPRTWWTRRKTLRHRVQACQGPRDENIGACTPRTCSDKENIDDEFEKIMLAAKAQLYLKEDNESIEVFFKTA